MESAALPAFLPPRPLGEHPPRPRQDRRPSHPFDAAALANPPATPPANSTEHDVVVFGPPALDEVGRRCDLSG